MVDAGQLVNVSLDLKVPGVGGIQGTWEPDETEVKAAWELYVELVTRAPLGTFSLGEGSAREAMTSMHSLFETGRGILKVSGPSVARPKGKERLSLGYLTVSMLNLVLRPFLTKWHPRLVVWERQGTGMGEYDWPDRREFLQSLSQVRVQLGLYASLFAEVAEVPELAGDWNVLDSSS
ncbi:MAG: hypothetical protein OXE87_00130 [Chloroflexi bacterium]|nr:hypothetical protein [Chloroflexota bacterium]